METFYQVFVSSTYLDLIDERKTVMNVLLQNNCIPRGMELFPANDETLLKTIKKVISESDYYILIIGGRYGSINSETKLSYTEMEYNIARELKIPVIPFVHNDIGLIPSKWCEQTDWGRKRLRKFISTIKENHTPQYWVNNNELSIKIASGLKTIFDDHPRAGLSKRLLFTLNNDKNSNELLVCSDLYKSKLDLCLNNGIYDEYISRNFSIRPSIKDQCFYVTSTWDFMMVSLKDVTPEFSFNYNSENKQFINNFKLISYMVNRKDLKDYAINKLVYENNDESGRYYILFHDDLELNENKTVHVKCVNTFVVSLPEYNVYSSYMYPSKTRDVHITIEGEDAGAWVLKANSFTAFRNLGNNKNAKYSLTDSYSEIISDSHYHLNIKEWTLPGTGFMFTVSKREHTNKCWLSKS